VEEGEEDHLVVILIEAVASEEEELHEEEVALVKVPTVKSWEAMMELLVVQLLVHMTVAMNHLDLDVEEVVQEDYLEVLWTVAARHLHFLELIQQMNPQVHPQVDLCRLMKLHSMDHLYQWEDPGVVPLVREVDPQDVVGHLLVGVVVDPQEEGHQVVVGAHLAGEDHHSEVEAHPAEGEEGHHIHMGNQAMVDHQAEEDLQVEECHQVEEDHLDLVVLLVEVLLEAEVEVMVALMVDLIREGALMEEVHQLKDQELMI